MESTSAPIGDYGLLGDTRTAALVSSDGSLDWFCVPRFDGEPVFGRLVGGAAAGRFRIGPATPSPVASRRYRDHSATLETSWETPEGDLTLTEGMVADVSGSLLPATLLVRRLSAHGGTCEAVVEFDPRLGEAHRHPRVSRRSDLVVCEWGSLAMSLRSDVPTVIEPGKPTVILVAPGQPVTFVVAVAHREPLIDVEPTAAWSLLLHDEQRWRAWAKGVTEDLRFREAVVRSLITLRLLTYSPSGAPVAAPTTSLPEHPGGVRNWDYRLAWPRDASIGIAAFLNVGMVDEARGFLWWLLHASRLDRPRLPVLLTLDGRRSPPERSLRDWPGYASSAPVRVGNGAANQHQLDGYGWVVDAAWVLVRAGHPLYAETWRAVRGFTDLVARRWSDPDAGIWEVRAGDVHHVHSKLMAWLALDRALRIAETHGLSDRQRRRWEAARAALGDEVRDRGFDLSAGTYTRSYGSQDLDAALLVLPLIGLDPPSSARVRGTIDAIRRDLAAGGPLLYRYPPGRDGLPGTEGAFLPCSFWLVQALARAGQEADAVEVFEQLLDRATPLGLYAEEMDPTTGEHLGNYPQALTAAALVQAALALSPANASHSGVCPRIEPDSRAQRPPASSGTPERLAPAVNNEDS